MTLWYPIGMLLLYSVVQTLGAVAVSLGVGSSTFALIFHFMGMRDTASHEAGRPYQRVVYIVLRVAMAIILLTEIAKGIIYVQAGMDMQALRAAPVLLFLWTIIAVLFVNAILMTRHLMPMKLGPAIQAASWYTLGVTTALPSVTFSYIPLILTYLGAVVALAVIIELITQKVKARTDIVHLDITETA